MTWVLAKVVFNNKAMVYAGAGVCAVIGTLSPVCTAVISSCCGRHLTVPCYVLCIGGACGLPMIASLSQRTASTSRFSQVLSWGGVIIAFFGALVISWGEVSSVQALGFGKPVNLPGWHLHN